jgi:hypothetical protein
MMARWHAVRIAAGTSGAPCGARRRGPGRTAGAQDLFACALGGLDSRDQRRIHRGALHPIRGMSGRCLS